MDGPSWKSTVMVRFCRVRVAAVLMCHPRVIRSQKLMRRNGGNTLKYQDNHKRLGTLPRKPGECERFQSLALVDPGNGLEPPSRPLPAILVHLASPHTPAFPT